MMNTIRFIQTKLNPMLALQGVVLTMFDDRTNLSRQIRADISAFFGDKLYETVIPRNVRLGEAPSFGKPILSYDRRCLGAESYVSLAREVLARHGLSAHISSFGIEVDAQTPMLREVV